MHYDLQQLPVLVRQEVLWLAPVAEAADQPANRLVVLPEPPHLHIDIGTYIQYIISYINECIYEHMPVFICA